jgi:hypothetical protein
MHKNETATALLLTRASPGASPAPSRRRLQAPCNTPMATGVATNAERAPRDEAEVRVRTQLRGGAMRAVYRDNIGI